MLGLRQNPVVTLVGWSDTGLVGFADGPLVCLRSSAMESKEPIEISTVPAFSHDVWTAILKELPSVDVVQLAQTSKEGREGLRQRGIRAASGPEQLADALADPAARKIIVVGGAGATVSSRPLDLQKTVVVAIGAVSVARVAVIFVHDGHATATDNAQIMAHGPAQVDASEQVFVLTHSGSTGPITATGNV